jgi:hypothetical protein
MLPLILLISLSAHQEDFPVLKGPYFGQKPPGMEPKIFAPEIMESDLYISFHKSDGSWTKLINMGEPINNELIENCPMISPDGKYFFFLRYNPAIKKAVTYWVSAQIIEALKCDKLK